MSTLKEHHQAISDSIPRINDVSDLDSYRLTEEQITQYREQGFIHNHQFIDLDMVQTLRHSLDDIVYGNNDQIDQLIGLDDSFQPIAKGDEVPMIYFQGAWLIEQAFHDLMFHPKITVPISQLLNTDEVVFWHDQIFYKPAQHGGNVCWHQDYSYWQRTTPCNHITVWLSLDDATLENGCLQVIPGSHQWGLLDEVELVNDDMNAIQNQLTAGQQNSFQPYPMPMNAGYCSFHHPMTLHGSLPNRSQHHRRAIILNFMGGNVVSNDDSRELMPGYPPISKGEKIRGDLWPVVLDLKSLT